MEIANSKLEAPRVPTNLKLASLWTSLMFLYIYNDYFSLYLPGTIETMMAGRIGPLGEATPLVLIGVSMMLAIPSVMIFLSVGLTPWISRWLNLVLGVAYTAIEALTFIGAAPFYKITVAFEIMLTILIVGHAWLWPKQT